MLKFLKKYIKTDEDIRKENQKLTGLNTGFITIPIIIVLLTIIILVSGIFGYKMIAIGSNSMIPVYEKGDAIIYEKVDGGSGVRYYIYGLSNYRTAEIPSTYKGENIVTLRGNTFSNMFYLESVN